MQEFEDTHAALGRHLVTLDEEEYEYHIESIGVMRTEASKIRSGNFKILSLPAGDELDQTLLATALSIEEVEEHYLALKEGSDDLEIDALEDDRSLAMLEKVNTAKVELIAQVQILSATAQRVRRPTVGVRWRNAEFPRHCR